LNALLLLLLLLLLLHHAVKSLIKGCFRHSCTVIRLAGSKMWIFSNRSANSFNCRRKKEKEKEKEARKEKGKKTIPGNTNMKQ
jgi:hypothetical protein